ncbi:hypothetical protein ACQI4F_01390 [Mycolicibacterium vaccae]|uniref:hypothetical protein n=1 Tax=Mycolicibacterium vaccae TaxID=1810 RepID=UPI003CFB30F7
MARRRHRRQPDTVRVAALDIQHSYRRSAVVVGPVDLPAADVLAERLVAMARVGPEARIGLVPSTTSTRWRFAPASVCGAVHTTTLLPGSDPVDLVGRLQELPESGVRVLAAEDHLAVDFSHGLGKIALLDLLLGVLLGVVDPADDAVWQPYRHRMSPLTSAALRALAPAPHRVLALLRRRRDHTGGTPAPPAPSVVVAPSTATRVLRIPAETVEEFRRQRDSHLPAVSLFAVYTCALHEAFADAGFDVEPAVTLPVDVRRYLPPGRGVLGTFSAGLSFPVGGATGPRQLHDDLAAAARMARPVANLMVGTVKAHAALRTRARLRWAAPEQPRMQLLHSSVGDVPRSPWTFSDPDRIDAALTTVPARVRKLLAPG